jgi:hypothetical protein
MANRILRPAGLDVSAARGCRLSKYLWGKYGHDASPDETWPELHHCSELEATAGLHEEGSPYLSQSERPRGTLTSAPARLDRMIDEHLGEDFPLDKRARLDTLRPLPSRSRRS